MIIMLDGLPASGKATLRGLLDGHSKIFAGYNHDMIVDAICADRNEDWLKFRDILYLRELLCKTHYNQLEYFGIRGTTVVDMKVDEHNFFKFQFDFHKMDEEFITKIYMKDQWTKSLIVESLFNAMLNAGEYPADKEKIKYYVSMGYNRPECYESFFREFPEGKILYLDRNVTEIIGVLTNRVPTDDDMWSKCLERTNVKKLIENGYVYKLKNDRVLAHKIAKEYPQAMLIINFCDLITETERVMDKICDFLHIEHESIMRQCTMSGQEMRTKQGCSFIGEVLDKKEKLLSKNELIILEIMLGQTMSQKVSRLRKMFLKVYILKVNIQLWVKKRMEMFSNILRPKEFVRCNEWKRNDF